MTTQSSNPTPVPTPATRAALVWLRDRMIEDIIPDYADGLYSDNPEAKAAVEEILRTNPEARAFHERYTTALASRSAEEWKAETDRILAHVHANDAVVTHAHPPFRVLPPATVPEQEPIGIAGKVAAIFRRASVIPPQPLAAAAATAPTVSEQWHLEDRVSSLLEPADANSCYLRLESGDASLKQLGYRFDGKPECSGQVELKFERGSYWAEIQIPAPYALLGQCTLTLTPTPQ